MLRSQFFKLFAACSLAMAAVALTADFAQAFHRRRGGGCGDNECGCSSCGSSGCGNNGCSSSCTTTESQAYSYDSNSGSQTRDYQNNSQYDNGNGGVSVRAGRNRNYDNRNYDNRNSSSQVPPAPNDMNANQRTNGRSSGNNNQNYEQPQNTNPSQDRGSDNRQGQSS